MKGRSGIAWSRKRDLPDEARAYLAGLFDGEGSVSVLCSRYRKRAKVCWSLAITFSNTDRVGLLRARRLARGIGSFGVIKRPTRRRRTLYGWRLSSQGAAWLLQQMRPWLRVRDRQADLGIRFTRLLKDRGGRLRVSITNTVRRYALKARIQQLNTRPRTTRAKHKQPTRRRWNTPKDLSTTLRAYLAGLFDGEGSVAATATPVRQHTRWELAATIGITDGFALSRLYQVVGRAGIFFVSKRHGRRAMFYWRTVGHSATWLLSQLRPWLRFREHQAALGLQLREEIVFARCHKSKPLHEGDLAFRHALVARVRHLNAYGRAA